jgi:predicted CXXCH cytochrome family protein
MIRKSVLSGSALGLIAVLALAPASIALSNDDCLSCHSDSSLKSGAGKPLFVDQKKFQASVHGQAGISCVDCHADLKKVKDFPHVEKLRPVDCAACHDKDAVQVKASVHGQPHDATNPITVACKDCHGTHEIRGKDDPESTIFPINLPNTCETCHLERVKTKRGKNFIEMYKRSAHYKALEKSGLTLSANCANCHGGHSARSIADPQSRVSRKNIIRTCGICHVGIEKGYLEGVHGKDYVKGSKDVPVCTDCHSEHNIQSPEDLTSPVYATKVAGVCTRCHDDERLARQYGFLTSRLKTYSNSYHGTASKFGETRVANCASCHGFHDIRTSSDPKSLIYPANLSKTCGKCHPGAGTNFAKGKIHVVSEKTENKWAYFAKIFYIVVIAGLIAIFLIFIAADLYHRIRIRWKH